MNYKLGSIEITNKGTDSAEINIEGVIGIPEWWQFDEEDERVSTYNKFSSKVAEIAELKVKNLSVNIRSLGGDVNHALMIHDALTMLNDTTVITKAFGFVASAATVIHQAGATREISKNSLYLIHQAQTTAGGTAAEIRGSADMLDTVNSTISDIYVRRSGRDKEQIEELMAVSNGYGKWLTADETLQFGLADNAIKATGATNFDGKIMNFMKMPAIPDNLLINNKSMKKTIITAWAVIASLWNAKVGDEVEVSDEMLTGLNNEITARDAQVEALTALVAEKESALNAANEAHTAAITAKMSEIDALKASATSTKPVEDPAIEGAVLPANRAAFDADAAALKED